MTLQVLGGFTYEPARPLQGKLRAFCDAAMDTGLIYVSSGSSAIPGVLSSQTCFLLAVSANADASQVHLAAVVKCVFSLICFCQG